MSLSLNLDLFSSVCGCIRDYHSCKRVQAHTQAHQKKSKHATRHRGSPHPAVCIAACLQGKQSQPPAPDTAPALPPGAWPSAAKQIFTYGVRDKLQHINTPSMIGWKLWYMLSSAAWSLEPYFKQCSTLSSAAGSQETLFQTVLHTEQCSWQPRDLISNSAPH